MSRNASCGTCSSKAGRVREVVIEPFLTIAQRINIPFVIKFKMVPPTLNWRRGRRGQGRQGGQGGQGVHFLLPVPSITGSRPFFVAPPFLFFSIAKHYAMCTPPPPQVYTSILCTFFFRFLAPFSSLMCSHSRLLTPAFSLASRRFFWS